MIFPPPDAATNVTKNDSTEKGHSVRLQQFVPHLERSQIELDMIFEAFDTLLRTSADAALDQEPSIYTFQEKCLYLGTIHDDSVNNLTCGSEQTAQTFRDEQAFDFDESYFAELQERGYSSETVRRTSWIPGPDSSVNWETGWREEGIFGSMNGKYRDDGTTVPVALNKDTAMNDSNIHGDMHQHQPDLSDHFAKTLVGIIYFLPHPQYPSEVSMGLALPPAHCNRGIGPRAALQALEMVFDQFAFHRVSATVVDGPTREHAIRMFVALGFAHEGFRRRAIMSAGPGQNENTWRDVHHLGLLDTDWTLYGGAKAILSILDNNASISDTGNNKEIGKGKAKAKRTRWDEMFTRHQREREELVGFDERDRVLRRTLSSETLRPATTAADSGAEALSGSEAVSDAESVRSRDRERCVSPAFSATTNPFASPADYWSRTQYQYDSTFDPSLSDEGSARDGSESMVAAWRASSLAAVDAYATSDMESETEMHALLPGIRRRSARNTFARSSPFVSNMNARQSMRYASPPPQSDEDSYASESEIDRYASCEEEEDIAESEGNDAEPNDPGSSTVISHLPSGLEVLLPSEVPDSLEGLSARPREAKGIRSSDSLAAAIRLNAAGREEPSITTPTSATASSDWEAQSEPTPVAGSSGISPLPQDFAMQMPSLIAHSLSYRLSEREILGADAMETDADLEGTWDMLSITSESESSVSSGSSFSLQSASDSE